MYYAPYLIAAALLIVLSISRLKAMESGRTVMRALPQYATIIVTAVLIAGGYLLSDYTNPTFESERAAKPRVTGVLDYYQYEDSSPHGGIAGINPHFFAYAVVVIASARLWYLMGQWSARKALK
jgi:hypothetical protein